MKEKWFAIMKNLLLFLFLILFFTINSYSQSIVSMKINGTINPLTSSFIHDGIQKAVDEKAECVIIHLNTPGGLLTSTRIIVSDILSSEVPVVVYVSPEGAHAGSAGVFITLAANIAAMSPGTNIGAAHPVSLQGTTDSVMNTKSTNDAAAFIRSIAQKRNRNLEWAENAVRNSTSITADEALEKNVIDIIASSEAELISKINGRSVSLNSGNKILNTVNAKVVNYEMTGSEKVLNMLSDPNIAYILMLIGIYGIIFELLNPGAIFPGVVGVISLILAFYSLHTLPVNYAGLLLIVFSLVLFILEIKIISHGLLSLGGIISMVLGSLMLFKTNSSLEFFRISTSVIVICTVLTTLFFLFVITLGLKAQRKKPITGEEGIIGETGECLSILDPNGNVRIHGEIWKAESLTGNIKKGEKIKVVAIRDLKLFVDRFNGPSLT
ncbi:MAG: nodulation protein NfeD [Daejeonella sp.]